MKIRTLYIVPLVGAFVWGTSHAWQATTGAEQPAELNDLDRQLLEGLDDAASDKPDAKKAAGDGADEGLDRRLLDELKEEKWDDESDPFGQIAQKMRRAQKLIRDKQPGDGQELQKQIVADIDKLIEQSRRQTQTSAATASNRQQMARRDQAAQPQAQPASAGGKGQQANEAARDSTAGLRNQPPARPELASTRQMVQELWGHLPERDRQQVMSSAIEMFIPKYELLIKEYFKRLTEAQRERKP